MSDEQKRDRAEAQSYQRADSSKFPTAPAGQQASVEGAAAASGWQIAKRAGAARAKIDSPAAAVLREKMLALLDEFDTTADTARSGNEAGHEIGHLAEGYAQATSHDARERIVAEFAEHASLPAAGLIRRAAKALESHLPALIIEHHIGGQSAAGIARELGYSHPTYVHKTIRDNPWEAVWTLYRAADGDTWEQATAGTCTTTESAENLAEQLLSQQLDVELSRRNVRLCVWRSGDENEQDPDFARAWSDREADTPHNH
ncbi:hypothetical protein ACQEVM_33285 [Streptomyces sp. CA-243310]|uniref:hypothetical protein n=2 Tax=Streptomyces sp. CA-243310 TaxID=3240056 RepID=UPI003D92D710